jgi:anti-sigma factor RsiW
VNHQTALRWLQAAVDRQVGPLRGFLLDRHVARCAICRAEQDRLLSMRTAIRATLEYHRAPPDLAARIGAALPREAPPESVPARSWRQPLGFSLAGALTGVALTGVALTLALTHPSPSRDTLVDEAVAGHVRSMLADHLTDIATSDRHTVKPWLSARLDFSPVTRDFATEGYPLVGGRLDYIAGRHAAALVYRRDKHVINLFVTVSDQPDAAPTLTQKDGFNVVSWRAGGLRYVAVSDVEPAQLQAFAALIRHPG